MHFSVVRVSILCFRVWGNLCFVIFGREYSSDWERWFAVPLAGVCVMWVHYGIFLVTAIKLRVIVRLVCTHRIEQQRMLRMQKWANASIFPGIRVSEPPTRVSLPSLRNQQRTGTRSSSKFREEAQVESSWNVIAHGDAREEKWRGNWRMEWVASTLHTTSEHGVSSITTADAHTSAASSRLNWRPRRFKWTRPFRRETKSSFCACAITFRKQSNTRLTRYFIFLFLSPCLILPSLFLSNVINFSVIVEQYPQVRPHVDMPCTVPHIWS